MTRDLKMTESLEGWIPMAHIYGTFDLVMFMVILTLFVALVSKSPQLTST